MGADQRILAIIIAALKYAMRGDGAHKGFLFRIQPLQSQSNYDQGDITHSSDSALKHAFLFGTRNVIWLHGREKCIHHAREKRKVRARDEMMIFARVEQRKEKRKLISSLLSALLYYARANGDTSERVFAFEVS